MATVKWISNTDGLCVPLPRPQASAGAPLADGDSGGPSAVAATARCSATALPMRAGGVVTVHRFPDGRRVVRLSEFVTSNGPDVRVYLVAADDVSGSERVTRAGFVDLEALKGDKGHQNYELPGGVDLDQYRAVTIWCRRFDVNFATAALQLKREI